MAPASTTAATTFKKQLSQDRMLRREVIAEKRRNSIIARETARVAEKEAREAKHTERLQMTTSKYPKRDIVNLKHVFDHYDSDGSGFIDRAELLTALHKEKERAQHFDGSTKTRAERQAGQGLFLYDFSESLFKAMDANTDGRVEFAELLRLLYPLASEAEMQTMLKWVSDERPEPTLEEFVLSDAQQREIRSMFALYDTNKSGTISRSEFRQAMRRCGLNAEETGEVFDEADLDGNKFLDLEEFTELMRKTLFGGEELTFSMLYSPI